MSCQFGMNKTTGVLKINNHVGWSSWLTTQRPGKCVVAVDENMIDGRSGQFRTEKMD